MDKKKLTYKNFMGEEIEVILSVFQYVNGGICIQLDSFDEELNCFEPYATITTALPGYCMDFEDAFLDTNNCKFVEKFIKANKLGTTEGICATSGRCIYPLYTMDLHKIAEYDPAGFAALDV